MLPTIPTPTTSFVYPMKSSALIPASRCCSLALLYAAFAVNAFPQSATPAQRYSVLTLDYQKPEPGKTGDYLKVERELWKPVHQDRVDKGTIVSWKLYSVSWPNGADQEYDYVTVTEFANFAALE